jgi:hypothetical protein
MFFSIDDFSSIILNFKKKFETGKNYELHIKKNVCDCAGNYLADDLIVPVAIPQQPDSFDVVINEVLFNSFPNGSEFIEIFNRSNKVIDAGSIIIATIDTLSGEIKSDIPATKPGFLMFPKTYLAITENIDGLEKFYHLKDKRAIVEQPGFPSLNDKKGIIALLGIDNSILDKFNYDAGMHLAQLSSTEGVSLERLNADWPTQQRSNWHSASQTSGFATPGYVNSQAENGIKITGSGEVVVMPEVFTPNNDGHDDVLNIHLNPEQPDCTATINIYNSSGRIVRHLLPKSSLSFTNVITWDGTSDENKAQPLGIYIIYVSFLSKDGKNKIFKEACVIGRK